MLQYLSEHGGFPFSNQSGWSTPNLGWGGQQGGMNSGGALRGTDAMRAELLRYLQQGQTGWNALQQVHGLGTQDLWGQQLGIPPDFFSQANAGTPDFTQQLMQFLAPRHGQGFQHGRRHPYYG